MRRRLVGIFGFAFFCTLAAGAHQAQAAIIDFDDGRPTATAIGSYYFELGMTTPNLRFHNSTNTTHVPFNFIDGWGAVVDFGVLNTNVGYINFVTPVHVVRIEGMGQAAFDLNGTKPYIWSILAFNSENQQIASASEDYGFDFSGVPNPPNTDPYPLARLSLSIETTSAISRLEIVGDGKVGFDTITFGAQPPQPPVIVSEPTTMSIVGFGLTALGLWRIRGSSLNRRKFGDGITRIRVQAL